MLPIKKGLGLINTILILLTNLLPAFMALESHIKSAKNKFVLISLIMSIIEPIFGSLREN